MDSEIVESITGWETVPFSGGYEGLRDLADADFSGAVTQGDAWAFMLNGRLVGIAEGSLSAFDGATGTAYDAPDPSLPLLYTMQTQGGEKQAEYYTNKTSISEADKTLSAGNFTGYIELSDNVLSGDYYVVYYGGKSMSVAFVGNSRALLTDEEAFSRADDEVGIYNVYAAEIEIIELPEPATTATTTSDQSPADDDANDADDAVADSTMATETVADDQSTGEQPTNGPSPSGSPPNNPSSTSPVDNASVAESGATESPAAEADSATKADREPTETPRTNDTDTDSGPGERATRPSETGSSADSNSESTPRADTERDADVFNKEAEWRNAKTIPSLDPSDDPEADDGGVRTARQPKQRSKSASNQTAASGRSEQLSRQQLRQRLARAEQIMQKAEARHNELQSERDRLRDERDVLADERETLASSLAEAEAEIERLEKALESAESDFAGSSDSTSTMGAADALAGTNLFIRYDSKGDPTLETAHAGTADAADVSANLRIEHHTTFESEGLVVDDKPFAEFLDGCIEVAFAHWLVGELLYEIRETGNQDSLRGVYDAIPQIDRIELHGSVELGTDEDETPIEREFDVITRDKMGTPLLVANFDESKHPVGGAMVESLIRDAGELSQLEDEFSGAFAVTTSYFDPAALEATADATSGGLLSRSRGKSFVSLSRKRGFHLCLADKLDSGFDLHVPEL